MSVTLRFEYQLGLKLATVKLLEMDRLVNALVASVRASTTASTTASSSAGGHSGMDVDSDADARVVLKENESALSWITKNVLAADTALAGLLDADDTGFDSPNSQHRLLFNKAK